MKSTYFSRMWTLHTDSGNNIYGGQTAKNIYLGDTRIVTKLNSGSDPTYQEEYYKQYYYHGDHLGSASLISDYKGDEYQRIEYTPYGETWVEKTSNTGLDFLPYRFTAKELDKETGLYYYGARYLDPKYSRWISTDPALGEYMQGSSAGEGGAYNTVNLNLYNYGNNNPVKYSDPDGNWVHIAIGAAIGGAIGGITAACAGGSARDVVAASVGGAVAGGLAAATCGASLGTAVAGSAMASTIGYLAESIVAGRDATVEGVAVSAAGGATGAMAGAVLEKGISAATSKVLSRGIKTNLITKNINGVNVIQDDSIINPNLIDSRGRTNVERMKKGIAPIGTDEKSVNLHHVKQTMDGSVQELTATNHQENYTSLHSNTGQSPSLVDRQEFAKWRRNYWKTRANDFKILGGK